ncbi:hypothetical protein B0J11DRAFT_512977 [Dendryphion nanum]|uniref:Uncharacterized protein n=1 Tax=Dendryphion nanum TaxID=256645 RepID=A0A9P9CY93_9PLEO|nr:hypothetical protein B0J11DRAFT_512977 [Dendryphion nanum]
MLFTSIFSAVLICGITRAAPLEEQAHKRASFKAAYLTTDWDWGNGYKTGDREIFWSAFNGQCIELAGTKFDRTVSSFGPEPNVACFIHEEPGCKGKYEPAEKLYVLNPGYARLGNLNWEDKIRSFECWVVESDGFSVHHVE